MSAPVFCGGSHEMKSLFVVSNLKIAGRGAPGQAHVTNSVSVRHVRGLRSKQSMSELYLKLSICTFVPVKQGLSAWHAHDANSVSVRRAAVALFSSLRIGCSHLDVVYSPLGQTG